MPPANMTVQDEEEDKMASEYSLWYVFIHSFYPQKLTVVSGQRRERMNL